MQRVFWTSLRGRLALSERGNGCSQRCAAGAFNIMTRRFRRWLSLAAGWSFIALGALGLFLPFLQGLLFLLIGITILSFEYAWARRLLQKLRGRFPSLCRRLDAAKIRAGEWLSRIIPAGSRGIRR
ncbi:MAG: hypothetical protein EPN47_20210 [Acidobacteria bacterium]|nr:MAG: hypothetical protein EPN47_20210 [Acidobacteriota bacterium]